MDGRVAAPAAAVKTYLVRKVGERHEPHQTKGDMDCIKLVYLPDTVVRFYHSYANNHK